MTTAHRPTWKAAVGRASEGGYTTVSTMRSVLDEAAHTKLKHRTGAQTVADREEVIRVSLLKLQEAEKKLHAAVPKRRPVIPEIEEEAKMKLLKHTDDQDVDLDIIQKKYDDRDEEVADDDKNSGWSDLDNTDDDSDLENSANDSEDDYDSDDEEIALQAELAKIKAERAASKKKEEERELQKEQEQLEDAARLGNPLLLSTSTTTENTGGPLKRRWNDDVVFRNQARGEAVGKKKRFINDTVRNDFHRRFLDKFIL